MWISKTVTQSTNDTEESKALNFQTTLYTNSSIQPRRGAVSPSTVSEFKRQNKTKPQQ